MTWEDYPEPVRDEATGCLRWQGPHHSHGYGKIGVKGYAHRIAYERSIGPIPPGLTVDHVWERGCRHLDCVEPTHLEAVTRAENSRRSRVIREALTRTHCVNGHLYTTANTHITRQGHRKCRECDRVGHVRHRHAADHAARKVGHNHD